MNSRRHALKSVAAATKITATIKETKAFAGIALLCPLRIEFCLI